MSLRSTPARHDGAARIGGTGKHLATRSRGYLLAIISIGAIALLFTVIVLDGGGAESIDVASGPDTTQNLQRIAYAAQKAVDTADPSFSTLKSTSTPGLTVPPPTAPPTTAPPTTLPPTTTTTEPPTTTTAPPTTQPPTTSPPVSDGSVWDRLAQCEAGGDWAINTGNGYYGGLQFSASSWRAVGGEGLPHQNSRETQIEMGKRLQARQGWGAWPSCARQLGLI
jgi:hypothetical protein